MDAGYDGVAILEHIRFEVRRGEVFGILGGSGCGKSTLMKHMIGLNPPIAGHVFIGGDDIVTADDAAAGDGSSAGSASCTSPARCSGR